MAPPSQVERCCIIHSMFDDADTDADDAEIDDAADDETDDDDDDNDDGGDREAELPRKSVGVPGGATPQKSINSTNILLVYY
jgi:hypothetical protein